ncbi:unnamed protein product [Pylaiella littoralis]
MAQNPGYNPNAQPAQAYVVQDGQQYPQGQPYQQPYGAQPSVQQQQYGQPAGATVVAQPYNGPTAQQAVVGQAGNGQHIVVVRTSNGEGVRQVHLRRPPPPLASGFIFSQG